MVTAIIISPRLTHRAPPSADYISPRLAHRAPPSADYMQHEKNKSEGDCSLGKTSITTSCNGKTFVLFVIFGVASLTPWNMFITATAYFESKFNGSTTNIEENYPSYFQTGAICCDVVVSFLTVFLIKYIKMPTLVYFSNGVMLAVFTITAVLSKIESSLWSTTFFIITEILFCLTCSGGAMYISTMWAITSTMDSIYIEAFLMGMSLAGIIASVLNIITLSVPGIDFVEAGFWYFLGATAILSLALVLFIYFHLSQYKEQDYSKIDTDTMIKPDNNKTSSISDDTDKLTATTMELTKATYPFGYSIFAMLFVTFLMFPAVLSMLESTSVYVIWSERYFLAVSLFLCFNVGDLVGRLSARLWAFPGPRLIPWYATGRLIFVLLLIMCNLQPRNIPVWFHHDIIPTVIVFIFAMTSGQILSMSLRYAPLETDDMSGKAMIGTIMAFWGAIGRVLGTLATYIVVMVIK